MCVEYLLPYISDKLVSGGDWTAILQSPAQEVRDADDRVRVHMNVQAHMPGWSYVRKKKAKATSAVTQFVFWYTVSRWPAVPKDIDA